MWIIMLFLMEFNPDIFLNHFWLPHQPHQYIGVPLKIDLQIAFSVNIEQLLL